MLFALASGITGQYFLYFNKPAGTGMFFLVLGVIFFVYADRKNTAEAEPEKPSLKLEMALFFLILALAVFFRLYRINEIPPGLHDDEAQFGLDSTGIMEGNLPIFIHNASMSLYATAFIFKVLGTGAAQIRITSAILGILAVPALYFFIRHVFGARMALAGAFLLAVMRWHVNFSRIGYQSVFAVFFFVIIFYFFYRAYRYGKLPDFMILGIATGLSQYTYQVVKLIPVWFCLFAVYIFFRDKDFFRKNKENIVIAALLAVIVFLPLGAFMLNHQEEFFGRQNKVSIFNRDTFDQWFHGRTLAQVAVKNVTDTLMIFNKRGDWNGRHNIPWQPELDFFTGVFAFLGFGWALCRLFRPIPFFLVSMFFIFLLPGFLSIEAPQSLRTIMVIPAVIVFAVIFMHRFFAAARAAGDSGIIKGISLGLFIIFFAAIARNNYNLYFIKQAENPNCWLAFTTDAYNLAKYYKSLGSGWRAIDSFQSDSINTFNFTYAKKTGNYYDWFNMQDAPRSIPIKPNGKMNYVYLLNTDYLPLVDSALRVLYPGGKFVPFYNRYSAGSMYCFAYEVPYSEIEKLAAKKYENGLIMRHFKTQDWTGEPDWVNTVPVALLGVSYGAFSCDWSGRIKIDKAGDYTFTAASNGHAEANIDNKNVYKLPGSKIFLGKGFHALNIRYSQDRGFGRMELRWTPPGGVNALVPCNVLYP